MNSKVSIIIPCYNSSNTITETIESAYKQTYSNIEIIVINDGSTENIEKILKPFLLNKNFIYEKIKNSGVSVARNFGVDKSSGSYLLFLDADDKIHPTFIEKCINYFESTKNAKIVYSLACYFDAVDTKWELPKYENLENFLISNCIPITALIKKQDYITANGFDPNLNFYEDWDLWISILQNGGLVHQIQEELFFYRKHKLEKSASDKAANNKNIHAHNRLKIYHKHIDLYDKYFNNFEYVFLSQFEVKKLTDKNYFIEQKIKKIESNFLFKLLHFFKIV